jgi:hypothetical protein
MADRMAAEIWLGGKLPRELLPEFPISDLRLDWDGTPFDWTTEAGILAARDEEGLLHFADCEVAWGEFQELEDFLREQALPFRRHSSGKYGYLPELVEFRPDLDQELSTLATDQREPLIATSALAPVLAKMAALRALSDAQVEVWQQLFDELSKLLPPTLPPLPPFEIVGPTDRSGKF